uniref:TXNDC16 second thioredoxin-like domain-containing protein n=1 Tax=Clytia hemisphaerica TaxID=252671 RepID=A0A7M5X730_9CNID
MIFKISLVVFLFSLHNVGCDMLHEVKQYEELKALLSLDDAVGVFFYTHNAASEFKSRTLQIMDKVQDRMKKSGKYWIRLIKVNCANPTIQDQKLPECEKKRSFVASKMKGKVVQPYSLSELFSVSSFEAQVISFVYNHMVSFAQNEEEAYQAMEHVKGSKDLIFMYTKGYGSQDHYNFLKFAIDRFGKYQFLLCTDQGIIEKMFGKQKSDEFGLWYFECAKTMKGGQCPQHQFKGQTFPRPEVMESFWILDTKLN